MEPEDLLPQLRDISAKLESAFQDMCDFEFTVQDGKLYVLGFRVGERTQVADFRIATDLFLEGKITGKTLVSRIEPAAIEKLLEPRVIIDSNVRELGRGLAASPGAARGPAAFSADKVVALRKRGNPAVFLCREMAPEDIHGVDASVGIVSFSGGMSSHGAMCCRRMGKPCVSAVHWSFDGVGNIIAADGTTIREGDPLTINGTTGVVYAGSADVETLRCTRMTAWFLSSE
jgi:pyruvate, orthophosphate dikinase